MAPYVNLIVVDVLDAGDDYDDDLVIAGFQELAATCDPDIISFSNRFQINIPEMETAINDLLADGNTIMVSSAGNTGANAIHYPAGCNNVEGISSAYTKKDQDPARGAGIDGWDIGDLCKYSTYGPTIDLAGPGYVNVAWYKEATSQSLYLKDVSGTSFATPVVAGAFALVFQAHHLMTGELPSMSLAKTAIHGHCDLGNHNYNTIDEMNNDQYATSWQNNHYGWGITDAWEAIMYIIFINGGAGGGGGGGGPPGIPR